ncbi:MAG: cytochrome c oxidase assembly factor Coa1 family protein, partial [Lysobacter sp.]
MNERPQPGWFGRNWKWFVPTGCLSLVLLFTLSVFALIGLGLKGASGLLTSAEPVKHSLTLAEANATVVAALGKPLETGMMLEGSLRTENSSGSADLTIPLKGPK